jgi:hypothetical protein
MNKCNNNNNNNNNKFLPLRLIIFLFGFSLYAVKCKMHIIKMLFTPPAQQFLKIKKKQHDHQRGEEEILVPRHSATPTSNNSNSKNTKKNNIRDTIMGVWWVLGNRFFPT